MKKKTLKKTIKIEGAVCRDSAIAENAFRMWFTSFGNGHIDLEDRERSVRLAVVDDGQIKTDEQQSRSHDRGYRSDTPIKEYQGWK